MSTIIEDVILSIIYVVSGTVYTITPQIAQRHNVTGTHSKEHPFEHPFLLMAFEYMGQLLCLLLWYIITGGVTPPRNPPGYGQNPINAAQDYDQPDNNDDDEQPLLGQNDAGNIQELGEGDGRVNDDDENMLDAGGNEGEEENAVNPRWNQPPVDQTKFKIFLFVVPAFFDISRYGLLYVALKLAYNSSYMLTRAAAVLFTVLLRVAFLSKHMAKYMWVSSGAVVVGIGLIGMTDFIHDTPDGYDKYGLAAGCLLMVMMQIMIAMQIVFEEKFMDKHSIHPLRVIGLEGLFAGVVAVILLLPFSYIKAGPFSALYNGYLVDIGDAFVQMKSSYILALCFVGRIVSKSVNYYVALRFVTNQHDSAKRITIDVHHDLIIWGISLLLGWQHYFYPQIFGFILVPIGMLVYCDVIPLPAIFRPDPLPAAAGPLDENELIEQQQQRLPDGEGQVDDDNNIDMNNP